MFAVDITFVPESNRNEMYCGWFLIKTYKLTNV